MPASASPATRIDGKTFVTHVYDGGAGDQGRLMAGDEIVSVDGRAVLPRSDRSTARPGARRISWCERQADAEPIAIDVPVAEIQPGDLFVKAIADSVKRVDQGGHSASAISACGPIRATT